MRERQPWDLSPEAEAKIRVRAAAPRLLEVCIWARNHLSATDNPMPDQVKAREVQLLKAIDAAILEAGAGD